MRRLSSPSSTPKSRMYGKTLSRHHYDSSLCLITMTYHYGPSLSRRQSVRSGGRGFLRGDATSRITCIRGTSISVLPLSPPRRQLGSLSYIYADNCAVADSNVRRLCTHPCIGNTASASQTMTHIMTHTMTHIIMTHTCIGNTASASETRNRCRGAQQQDHAGRQVRDSDICVCCGRDVARQVDQACVVDRHVLTVAASGACSTLLCAAWAGAGVLRRFGFDDGRVGTIQRRPAARNTLC